MFLKNKIIIFKIRRSKVTDYAALMRLYRAVHLLYVKLVNIVYTYKMKISEYHEAMLQSQITDQPM